MPRKTVAQMKQEIGFRESIPVPCCANCKHNPGFWSGCKHPKHEFALQKSILVTVCDDYEAARDRL